MDLDVAGSYRRQVDAPGELAGLAAQGDRVAVGKALALRVLAREQHRFAAGSGEGVARLLDHRVELLSPAGGEQQGAAAVRGRSLWRARERAGGAAVGRRGLAALAEDAAAVLERVATLSEV